MADLVVAVLREPGDGDVVMIRGGPSDITRLSPDEVIPFFEAAAGPPLTGGERTVPLTEAATVILRFADADTGVAYPIRSGTDLVGAIFFLVRASRIARHASDDSLGLLLRLIV